MIIAPFGLFHKPALVMNGDTQKNNGNVLVCDSYFFPLCDCGRSKLAPVPWVSCGHAVSTHS